MKICLNFLNALRPDKLSKTFIRYPSESFARFWTFLFHFHCLLKPVWMSAGQTYPFNALLKKAKVTTRA